MKAVVRLVQEATKHSEEEKGVSEPSTPRERPEYGTVDQIASERTQGRRTVTYFLPKG